MPIERIKWACDVCKGEYHYRDKALSCEKKHTPLSAITVTKLQHDDGPEGFPHQLVVTLDTDKARSLIATYMIARVEKLDADIMDNPLFNINKYENY